MSHIKIFDGAGLIQAVLKVNPDNVNIVTPNGTVETVGTIDDVKAKFGGDYLEIDEQEFDGIYSKWVDDNKKAEQNDTTQNPQPDNAPANGEGSGTANAGSDASAAANVNGNSEPAKEPVNESQGSAEGDGTSGQAAS